MVTSEVGGYRDQLACIAYSDIKSGISQGNATLLRHNDNTCLCSTYVSISFPNTGGIIVSDDTLSPNFHGRLSL